MTAGVKGAIGGSPEERGQYLHPARDIGSRWQHRFFYTLVRFLGRRPARAMAVLVAAYYTLFRPSVRERTRPYLLRRFPDRSPFLRVWDSFRLTAEFAMVLVDRAAIGILGRDTLSVQDSRREEILDRIREGKGLILVSAHAGCWQYGMGCLENLGTRISLVLQREAGEFDRHLFEYDGNSSELQIIDPSGPFGGTLEMLQALKNRGVLCIMGDRARGSDRSSIRCDFLGDRVRVPVLPYQLASATGAPVVVIFPYPSGPGSYSLRVAKLLRVPEGLGRNAEAYRPYAQEFLRELERFVEEHPYRYFNFFNPWDQEPKR